jgi:hypothetical protein
MTDNDPSGPSQPGDLGPRRRDGRALYLGVALMSVALAVFGFREAQHDCPFFTWDDVRGCIEMPVATDSPGMQLVGDVTVTRRYSMFRSGAPSASVKGATVIYEDHHYFLVEGARDGFFRSLIDRNRYPHIGIAPLERRPLGATSSREAIDEAERFLKKDTGPWY